MLRDLAAAVARRRPEEAAALEDAIGVLAAHRVFNVEVLAQLSDAQWARLALPVGIEALLRDEARAQLHALAPSPAYSPSRMLDPAPGVTSALAAAEQGWFPAGLGTPGPAASRGAEGEELVRKPYQVRLARLRDLPRLCRLEELAWAPHLRAPSGTLRARLEASPNTNLVCVMAGLVVAVLYMQRIQDDSVLDQYTFQGISAAHSSNGRLLQLIAIAKDPAAEGPIGSELRAFALHLARLDPGIEGVVAVTLAGQFRGSGRTMQEYVDDHAAGVRADPVLGFHTSFGARLCRLCPGYRPEDVDNLGVGVLVRYDLGPLGSGGAAPQLQPHGRSLVDTTEVLLGVLAHLGHHITERDMSRGFFDCGIDSIDIGLISSKLGETLATRLPPTLLFDYPNVSALAAYLDGLQKGTQTSTQPAARAEEADPFQVEGAALDVDSLEGDDVIRIQRAYKRVFSAPPFQEELKTRARLCKPDKLKYTLAIWDICERARADVLLRLGLLPPGGGAEAARAAALGVQAAVQRHWAKSPELRQLVADLEAVTYQDASWPE